MVEVGLTALLFLFGSYLRPWIDQTDHQLAMDALYKNHLVSISSFLVAVSQGSRQ
jgi:hypothetical protein